jgi:hypothetical protein
MSHATPIQRAEGWDLETLKRMCALRPELFEFVEGQTEYRWYGRHMGDYPLPKGFTAGQLGQCDHAIRVKGARYEIGVVVRENGVHLLWDFWRSGGLENALGKEAWRLQQDYDVTKAVMAAEAHGHTWAEMENEKGEKVLEVYEQGGGWSASGSGGEW